MAERRIHLGPAEAGETNESRCRTGAGTVWLPTVMGVHFQGWWEQSAAGRWALALMIGAGLYGNDRLILK